MRIIGFIAALLMVNTAGAQQLYFAGSVEGRADESMVVTVPSDFYGSTRQVEIPVVDGRYGEVIPLPVSGTMDIRYKGKDRSMIVWNGADSLLLDFDADFLEADAQLSGEAGRVSIFHDSLADRFQQRLSVAWVTEQAREATNIDALEMDIFRIRNRAVGLLNDFPLMLPETFRSWFKNHLGYYYYLSLFRFSAQHSAQSSIPKATEIPAVLIEGLSWERMNREEALDSWFFRELLLEYVRYQALAQYDFMKFPDRNAAVQEQFNVARENLKGPVLGFFLTRTMLNEAGAVRPSLLRSMHDHLATLESAEDEWKLVEDSLRAELAAEDKEVAIAVPDKSSSAAPDFEAQDRDGKTFQLSDLKGNVVYLDIWASWCGPCRKQFPFAKELKAQLSKKELRKITFLYISIDNTETVWKKAIDELGLEGVHGLSKGGWGSSVTSAFGVNSIPRYVLINKNGEVVNPNAPRPSDPRLLELLRKLASE